MKIKETDVNARVKQAYVNAVPDICDAILSDCKQEKGQVVMMEEAKKKKSIAKYLMTAAACLVLIAGGGFGLNAYHLNRVVASTISLEVNPSIEITVNEKERVLDVKALNRDGEVVIGDMDFSGSDVDVVVNALIGSMLRNGYLNELANSILISVDNDDPAKGEILQERLTQKVNELLEEDGFFGAVLGQTLTENSDLQAQADMYGITLGKAQLIEQILNSTQGHTFEELASLSINDLNLLITTREQNMDKVSAFGNASDKAYIGEMKAKEIALAHAGVPESAITVYQMDMDLEKGVMVYEIEFKYNGFEYEYDIDAQTGDVVKNKKEVDDDAAMPVQPDEKMTTQPAGSANGTTDTDYYLGEHHYEPEHNGSYYNGNPHHNGTYYSGSNGNTGNTGGSSNTGSNGNTSTSVTVEQAKEIALNHAGQTAAGVSFTKAKQDYDDGLLVYEIEFIAGNTEYEYEINAQTGDIVKNKKEMADIPQSGGNSNTGSSNTSAAITLEQAKEIALNHAGQTAAAVYFEKAKQDYDDGILVYEIEFKAGNTEYEYDIDAQTGAIRDYEWDYD